jgi:murein DD-endopeptidase MepM/ murein hydrolase activator NlpD
MAKKLSFIILNNSGTTVRQFAVPVALLVALVLVVLSGAAVIGISVYEYQTLRQSLADNHHMGQTIDNQQEVIGQQRLQLQSFAHEIDGLKEKLVKLDQFEKKIRVIADLAPSQADDNLFGVGGAAPEDLDPQLELTQRHEGLMREMHRHVDELDKASHRQAENLGTLLDKLEGQRNLLASTPAIRPTTGWMTSRFGRRVSPFTGRKELHKGVDIANRKGTAVLATANGVVSYAGKKGTMGNILVIDHGHGIVTRYAHLSKALKKRGASGRQCATSMSSSSAARCCTAGTHRRDENR